MQKCKLISIFYLMAIYSKDLCNIFDAKASLFNISRFQITKEGISIFFKEKIEIIYTTFVFKKTDKLHKVADFLNSLYHNLVAN